MAEGDQLPELENWRDYIPEEMRATPLIEETKSVAELAKQALDYQRQQGSMIRIPGDDASDEVKADFKTKLETVGMVPLKNYQDYVKPKEAALYKLDTPPADAVDLSLTQGMIDAWKDQAHTMGLSNEQFNAMSTTRIEQMRHNHDTAKANYQTQEEALRNHWGPHGYEANKQRALNAAMRFGGEDLYNALQASPDLAVLRALGEVGKQFEEQGMGDLNQPLSLPETKDEAAIKLNEILTNKKHPFNQGTQAGAAYKPAAAEVMRLRRILKGEPANAADDMFVN